jgi:hypothetical protein
LENRGLFKPLFSPRLKLAIIAEKAVLKENIPKESAVPAEQTCCSNDLPILSY